MDEIQSLKGYLDDSFEIKDLGEAHFFLGIEISPSAAGIVLTQRKFTGELLEEFGGKEATLVIWPLDCNLKLAANERDFFDNLTLYRRLLGNSTA